MMISTRGRYALRVIIDLAEHADNGYSPMKDVAMRQEISLKYLEKILPVLTKNGLLEGVHGKGGGYCLTRKPEQYQVGEILRLMEGNLVPVACLDCDTKACSRTGQCKTLPMWEQLNCMINTYFDSITIADLMNNVSMKEIIQEQEECSKVVQYGWV